MGAELARPGGAQDDLLLRRVRRKLKKFRTTKVPAIAARSSHSVDDVASICVALPERAGEYAFCSNGDVAVPQTSPITKYIPNGLSEDEFSEDEVSEHEFSKHEVSEHEVSEREVTSEEQPNMSLQSLKEETSRSDRQAHGGSFPAQRRLHDSSSYSGNATKRFGVYWEDDEATALKCASSPTWPSETQSHVEECRSAAASNPSEVCEDLLDLTRGPTLPVFGRISQSQYSTDSGIEAEQSRWQPLRNDATGPADSEEVTYATEGGILAEEHRPEEQALLDGISDDLSRRPGEDTGYTAWSWSRDSSVESLPVYISAFCHPKLECIEVEPVLQVKSESETCRGEDNGDGEHVTLYTAEAFTVTSAGAVVHGFSSEVSGFIPENSLPTNSMDITLVRTIDPHHAPPLESGEVAGPAYYFYPDGETFTETLTFHIRHPPPDTARGVMRLRVMYTDTRLEDAPRWRPIYDNRSWDCSGQSGQVPVSAYVLRAETILRLRKFCGFCILRKQLAVRTIYVQVYAKYKDWRNRASVTLTFLFVNSFEAGVQAEGTKARRLMWGHLVEEQPIVVAEDQQSCLGLAIRVQRKDWQVTRDTMDIEPVNVGLIHEGTLPYRRTVVDSNGDATLRNHLCADVCIRHCDQEMSVKVIWHAPRSSTDSSPRDSEPPLPSPLPDGISAADGAGITGPPAATVTPPPALPTAVALPSALPTAVAPPPALPTAVAPPSALPTAVAPPSALPSAVAPPSPSPFAVAAPSPSPTAVAPPFPSRTAVAAPTPSPTAVAPPFPSPTAVASPFPSPSAVAPPSPSPTALAPPSPSPFAVASPFPSPSAVAPPFPSPTALALPFALPTDHADSGSKVINQMYFVYNNFGTQSPPRIADKPKIPRMLKAKIAHKLCMERDDERDWRAVAEAFKYNIHVLKTSRNDPVTSLLDQLEGDETFTPEKLIEVLRSPDVGRNDVARMVEDELGRKHEE